MKRCKRVYQDQRGMTLVEMIVSLVIFSIISTGVVSMFVFASNSFAEHQTLVAEQAELRLAMNFIVSELSLATMVAASAEPLTSIEGIGSFMQLSVEGSGMEAKLQRKQMPSGSEYYPYPMRVEDLQLFFSPEVVNNNLNMVKVRLSTKRYTLEQDVLCRNVPFPFFEATTQYHYISYIKPAS